MTSELAVSASVEAETAPATEERTVAQRWTPGKALSVSIDEKEQVANRFWEKVDKRSADECWEWRGSRKAKGYGRFHLDGRMQHAHRVAFALAVSEVPPELHVLHRCDNPGCCNPNHLAVGSALDNVRDMVKKNRQARGEAHGRAKLTSEIAVEIRHSDESLNVLSEAYGVHPSVVSSIRLGKHWRSASPPTEGTSAAIYQEGTSATTYQIADRSIGNGRRV